MSVFMDLNVLFSADRSRLQSLVETAAHLGFSTVAINYVFEPTTKKKQEVPSPVPISELIGHLPVVQGRSRPIKVLNRLTVVMSEASHFRPNATEYRAFDLLAIQPTTEKLFHTTCMLCDVDIICISVTEKLPFFFKRAPINGAIDRGVVFEVSYASALRDSTMRRYTIANAVCLMESCKGKNVIVSSAAEKALELRGPYDIINLYPPADDKCLIGPSHSEGTWKSTLCIRLHETWCVVFLTSLSEGRCLVCQMLTLKKPCLPPAEPFYCMQKPGRLLVALCTPGSVSRTPFRTASVKLLLPNDPNQPDGD
ncbi:ribonuclease P protein subunit p30 isoform X2 [Poecilia formosa]|uniref:ribonuclease P protein subunit p30 isoform X2 n=1 Tax=Poecilia formosa TaxID=48698 RepID=UPI0007BADB9A|nr:PREDICTED: ribonuclease P protein subunit p30 isoform X2 [Poecilia formosa]